MNELDVILYAAIVFGIILAVVVPRQKSLGLEGKITILGVAIIIESLLVPYVLYLHIPVFREFLSGLFDFMSTTSPEVSGIIMLAIVCLYFAPAVSMAICIIGNKEVAEYIMTLQRKITINEISENKKRLIEAPAG